MVSVTGAMCRSPCRSPCYIYALSEVVLIFLFSSQNSTGGEEADFFDLLSKVQVRDHM